jgi:mannosyltransferase OCH1-like enzyme
MEKIIHQIWIGEYEMLERDRVFCNQLKEMNTDYEYVFWNNNNLPKLPEKLENLKNIFVSTKNWVMLADMLRLYVVYEYGGIYLDCDYEVFDSFSNRKLDENDGFIHLNHWSNDPTICSSFFGFTKGHPMLIYVYNQIANRWMGPHFFGEYIKDYLGLDIRVDFDDMIVHEKLKEMNIASNSSLQELREFALHHGSATWLDENKAKLKLDKNYKGI